MTIVVTGASGQFGQSAVERLLQSVPAEDLILVTRRPQGLAEFAARGCDVRVGDYDDPASLVDAYRGGERLLMISGTRVGKRVAQHTGAINAAKAAGVHHIVYTSFVGSTPKSCADVSGDHCATEAALLASGLEWTVLRDAQYAEAAVDVMAPSIIRAGKMLSVAGDGQMAFVSREDCVASAVAVLTGDGYAGRVYDITGPDLVSYRELAAMIAETAGRPIEFVPVDEAGLYAMFDVLGVPREPVDDNIANGFPWNSDDMVSFEAAVRDGHFAILSDDVERLTGRPPRSLRSLFEARSAALRAIAFEETSPTS